MNGMQLGTRILAAIAVIFGAMTIVSGGQALFGGSAGRFDFGNVVPLVLWFNFVAGFFYIAAGVGLLLRKRWGSRVAVALAIATLLVFAIFGIHVATGGAYEMRTVAAMTLRSAFWVTLALVAMRSLKVHRP